MRNMAASYARNGHFLLCRRRRILSNTFGSMRTCNPYTGRVRTFNHLSVRIYRDHTCTPCTYTLKDKH